MIMCSFGVDLFVHFPRKGDVLYLSGCHIDTVVKYAAEFHAPSISF